MSTITFDIHRFIRKLKEAGFEEKQAEAVAGAFRDAQAGTEAVTRYDLKELELSLKAEMQLFRAEMQSMEYGMTIKLSSMMAASVAITAALVKLL